MDMNSEHRIPAPRAAVWAALNDPDVLQRCIPGCKQFTRESDDCFAAKVVAAIGPVKATFNGRVQLDNINPPHGYTLTGEGKGGAAGFAKAAAVVELHEDGDHTVLSYSVKATVGGKLAQMGSRLVDGAAKKMADQFFANFCAEMEGEQPAATEPVTEPEAADAAAAGTSKGATNPEKQSLWKRMF
jgi:carbon monoxide dehydrogenase subunit G